jgi:hypothetical protein
MVINLFILGFSGFIMTQRYFFCHFSKMRLREIRIKSDVDANRSPAIRRQISSLGLHPVNNLNRFRD